LLEEFRSETVNELESLKELEQKVNVDDFFDNKENDISSTFMKKVFELTKVSSDNLVIIANKIITSSISILKRQGREPPCSFVVVGLGSIARGEATPYSDLEYIFIVESNEEHQYFKDLAMDTYFRLGNCGETPLKSYDIQEPELDSKEMQSLLRSIRVGFRFDGISEPAGNIPTGKPGGKGYILTVVELMELYKKEVMAEPAEQVGDVSDLLFSTIEIYASPGGNHLLKTFQTAQLDFEIESGINCSRIIEKRLYTLFSDMEKYSFKPTFTTFGPPENFDIKVKTDIFRFPTIIATDIGHLFNLSSKYPWEKYEDLVKIGLLSTRDCSLIHFLLALSIYTRLCTYLHSNSKYDLVSLYKCVNSH